MVSIPFKTEFCMFKVNKSEFNVTVAITSHPVEAFKNDQNTHKKQKQNDSLGAFFKVRLKMLLAPKSRRSGVSLTRTS